MNANNMVGPGSIMSFELDNNSIELAKEFVNSLSAFKIAVSVGDCKSYVEIPSLMTHRGLTEEELKIKNISRGMIRMSIVIEEPSKLILDIESALNKLSGFNHENKRKI